MEQDVFSDEKRQPRKRLPEKSVRTTDFFVSSYPEDGCENYFVSSAEATATSFTIAISAPSPRRGPIFRTCV